MDRVKERVITVTGGGGGLGKAEPLLPAKEGAAVVAKRQPKLPILSAISVSTILIAVSNLQVEPNIFLPDEGACCI